MKMPWSLRVARRIAELLLPPSAREYILGDLEELHGLWSSSEGRPAADHRYLKALFASVVAQRFQGPRTERTERGLPIDVLFDLRQVARGLRRRPAFVIVVALTLGAGIGAIGAVFGMANQLLLRPLPGVSDPSGGGFLVFSSGDRRHVGISGPLAEDIRRAATLLDGFATYDYVNVHVSRDGLRPVDVRAYTIWGEYFDLLGVRPVAGRLLGAEETGPDADPFVAVISERLWETLFNRSPDAVGQRIRANGHAMTVVGVAGGGFTGTDRSWEIDVWVPRSSFVPLTGYPAERLWSRESSLNQDFVVRPKPDVTFDAAEAQLNQILSSVMDGERAGEVAPLRATLHPGLNLGPDLRRAIYPVVGLLAAAGFLVLLIPCANVANLLLVRALQGRGEIAVRRALGASTGRIARRALLESLILGFLGTASGLAVAWLIGLAVRGERLFGLPGFDGFVVDARILAFACAAVVVTALLSGTLPAVVVVRFGARGTLREAEIQSTKRHSLLRRGLSALQIALSLTLLIGSALLMRTVSNLYAVDPGVDLEGVYIVTLEMGVQRREGPRLEALHRDLLSTVRSVPGVDAAALASFYGPYMGAPRGRIALSDPASTGPTGAVSHWVTPGWFELFGVHPAAGRTFRGSDWGPSARPPVILTAALANRLFGSTEVVGRLVHVGTRDLEEAEIVGVVGDLRLVDLRSAADEAYFQPYPPVQTDPIPVLVRVSETGPGMEDALQRAFADVAPDLPIPRPELLTTRVDGQLAEQRILMRLLGLLSILAVVVALIGLYGVVAFAAVGRTREFAIRFALGADGHRISRLVLQDGFVIVLTGVACGLGGGYALSRLLEARLFGVAAMDPLSYLAAVLMFAAIAGLACWVPARAARGVDPIQILNSE